MDNISLESSWKKLLIEEFAKPYMQKLKAFLIEEKHANKIIYPKGSEIFNAFSLTPIDKVKIVIIGQDPYHGVNQAHGLCFSVLPEVALPRSLINIYKELRNDLGIQIAKHGCLSNWAKQGVLLLNSVLTVQAGIPGSHSNKGWEIFTHRVVELLNDQPKRIIFMLWGNYACNKAKIIDLNKHVVLKAAHPSPFSAMRGFFGCKHFSTANQLLQQAGLEPINWRVD